jgi:hypothetical protein
MKENPPSLSRLERGRGVVATNKNETPPSERGGGVVVVVTQNELVVH